jgi:hypothetical protein
MKESAPSPQRGHSAASENSFIHKDHFGPGTDRVIIGHAE